MASLCAGAYLLASTGLLNGKKCATHWAVLDDFNKMFPEVNTVNDQIITEEDGIYTGGGNYSFLNLLLYLVEKDTGRETAILVSKMFEIDIHRNNQNEFAIFKRQKDHGDETLIKVQRFIEKEYLEELSTNVIAVKFNINRRTLERKFKALTGNSIFEYVQRVRVEVAKRELEMGIKTVNEIVYEVGYLNVDAFRDIFKKMAGLSPVEYKKKYSKHFAG